MTTQQSLPQQVAALENLHQDLWQRLFSPGVLTGEQVNAALLLELVTQNAQILKALQAPAGSGSGAASALPVSLSVSFPLAPGETNNLIAATPELAGYRAGAAIQFATIVDAGATAVVNIPPSPGEVLGLLGLFTVSSTDVGAATTVKATQDGAQLIGPQGFVLGPAVALPVPGYAVTTGLQITLTNPSAVDVTVYMSGVALSVTRQFYDGVVVNLQNQAWTMILRAFGLVLPG